MRPFITLNPPFPNTNCQNNYSINIVSHLSEESETLNPRLNGTPLGIRGKQLWRSESHKAASLTAAAFTASLRSGALRKASLSRSAIKKAYPGKYTTEIQKRDLKMKILEPKRYEVDPAITTSKDENASLTSLTVIEPESSMSRDVRLRVKFILVLLA